MVLGGVDFLTGMIESHSSIGLGDGSFLMHP
jgi:hypothetical protein